MRHKVVPVVLLVVSSVLVGCTSPAEPARTPGATQEADAGVADPIGAARKHSESARQARKLVILGEFGVRLEGRLVAWRDEQGQLCTDAIELALSSVTCHGMLDGAAEVKIAAIKSCSAFTVFGQITPRAATVRLSGAGLVATAPVVGLNAESAAPMHAFSVTLQLGNRTADSIELAGLDSAGSVLLRVRADDGWYRQERTCPPYL